MRHLKDTGDAYRVRVTHSFKRQGTDELHVSYLGPYATLGTARGVVTRESRYRSTGSSTFAVERATTNWEEVPA